MAFNALAQAPVTPAAYAGPRFPGGPDSLRALVYRSSRLIAPSLARRAVVQIELQDGQKPVNFKVLGPPQPAKSELAKATQAAVRYLQAQMPAWQPAPPQPEDKPGKNPRMLIALNFASILSGQPYSYADQEPVFPYLAGLLQDQRNANFKNNPEGTAVLAQMVAARSTYSNLSDYAQRQVRYPAAALRGQQQGKVTAYFEVAENGAIENAEILTSASTALDEEVLRAVRSLRPASTPALLRGQPVRVFYVVPFTFRIQ
ncbi:TonB family C-terminal domain-containing protein [Hymenobacter arizonensis]|uniref:TonB family C-terminal domain-containing protein n=2 Tax=Hymenobacter arizonensis TaxID=1227077 RepID=A0A1I5WWI8_HYMAR|nr:TonB family C-terminal domain-containing protein [Hymenobacter arizonensis]